MQRPGIVELLRKNPRVPTISAVAAKVLTLAADEETTATEIAEVISLDPGLSSKILAIANSSFYGGISPVSRVTDAVRIMGMRAVRNAVLGISVFGLMGERAGTTSQALAMWVRSLYVSALAQMLAQHADLDSEEAFLLGLLSDVGILALIHLYPMEYERCAPHPGMSIQEFLEGERAVFGIDHPEAGRILAERWKLPPPFCEAIAQHHAPPGGTEASLDLSIILRLASSVVHSLHDGRRVESLVQERGIVEQTLKIEPREVDEMLAVLPERVAEIVSEFDLSIEAPASFADTLLVANERLAEMNQKYEELARGLEEENRRLWRQASVDRLTGIARREVFDDALKRECARAARYRRSLVLAIGDLDHFKDCNDQHGCVAGDEVLRTVGSVLSGCLRRSDLAARYGGEEFAVLMPETEIEPARVALERLRLKVQEHPFESEQGCFSITISFGLAAFNAATDAENPLLLVQRADSALCKAKQHGRNGVFCEGDSEEAAGPAFTSSR